MAAMRMRKTDNPRRKLLITLPGCIFGFPPAAMRWSSASATFRTCSRSAALSTQLPDSTLAIVRKPRMTGSVMVGSGCASEASVKNDSESNGVGSMDNRDSTTVNIKKTGSWDSGGTRIVGSGVQRCSLSSSFRLVVSCRRSVRRTDELCDDIQSAHTCPCGSLGETFCRRGPQRSSSLQRRASTR